MLPFGLMTYRGIIREIEAVQASYRAQIARGLLPYYVAEPELGWSIGPDRRHSSLPYTSDSKGFRRSSDTDADASLPVVSLWGDSMVHGDEVADSDTWAWQLQERLAGRYRVLNGGISAYGCDQAVLRFGRITSQISSRIAILGYVTADLYRHVNIERAFHFGAQFPLFKPRYVVDHDEARLISPPQCDMEIVADVMRRPDVRELLSRYDCYFPRLWPQILDRLGTRVLALSHLSRNARARPEALDVTLAIFRKFHRRCAQFNIRGIIVLLPVLLGPSRSGDDFDWLAKECTRNNLPCVDLRFIFSGVDASGVGELFCPKRHYSRKGGMAVAAAIADLLASA